MKVYFWEGHCTAVSEPPGLAVFLSHTHTKKRHQVSTLIPILDLRTSQPEPVVDLGENFGTLALVYRAHTHMVNWDTCAFSATIKSTLPVHRQDNVFPRMGAAGQPTPSASLALLLTSLAISKIKQKL